MQMCVVEMTQRPGKPLFHLEHYIEGKYIKYNSNSGFVRDDNIRLTPQVSDVRCRKGKPRLTVSHDLSLPRRSSVRPSATSPLSGRAIS